MQISRHWRMNSQRYRLQGVRYGNGEVALQERPVIVGAHDTQEMRAAVETRQQDEKRAAITAA